MNLNRKLNNKLIAEPSWPVARRQQEISGRGIAWKFTGKPAVATIEFGRMTCDGTLVFSMRDNSVGFNMNYADKLFGAFQRLHTAAEFPSTGIRRATLQRIIHRHHGRTRAESEAGRGATFNFTLPTQPTKT